MALPKASVRKLDKGFTMVEMLVVVGLIAIIMALGLAMSMDSFRGFSFRNDRDAVVVALQRARSQAVNNICIGDTLPACACGSAGCCCDGKRHGVHFFAKNDAANRGRIVIFQGDSYNADDTANEPVSFEGAAAFVDIAAPRDIVFDQLSGNSYPGVEAAINFNSGTGRVAVIKINAVGCIDF